MASIFSKIVKGELPAHKIAEDANFLAFLDIQPLAKGHTLVIPKKETDYLFDIDDAELANLMVFAKKVAKKIDAVMPCERVGVAVIGLEVPHAHIHLVPINGVSDLDFSRAKLSLPNEEMEEIAARIREA